MYSGNFVWLLLAMLVFLFGVPFADEVDAISGPVARALSFSTLLGIGVLSLYGTGRPFAIAITFVVLGILFNIAAAQFRSHAFVYGSFLSIFGFLATATGFTFRRIATDNEISANRIVGAVVVYMLLGVIWAVSYTLLEYLKPGSFSGFEVSNGLEWDSEWLYFSFVTMSTLGYGDITPVGAMARVLAYMQAMFGQLYIAVLVAGLVGAYVGNKQADANAHHED